MSSVPAPFDAAALLATIDVHLQSMPPVAALGVRIDGYDGEALRLSAPLSANVNDKGCAFGGSLASLMTLAGWGMVTLKVEAAGLQADVFVADSTVRYRAPVYVDLAVTATRDAEAGTDWPVFLDTLRSRGRARITIRADCTLADGTVATESTARFVAIAR